MALPDDPPAFLAAAARAINERDLEATAAVYAHGALFESLTDGAHERFIGADAIRGAWRGYLAAMDESGFRLEKQLVSAASDTVVNEWTGTLGGRTRAQGMELWRFDRDGLVAEHRMYSFLDLRPSSSPLARIRLGLGYPRAALAFLREGRRSA